MEDRLESLAYLAGSILRSYNIISEKQFKGISVKTFSPYTKSYFLKNIKMRCALTDIPENLWKECDEKLRDPKFDILFKPEENQETNDTVLTRDDVEQLLKEYKNGETDES